MISLFHSLVCACLYSVTPARAASHACACELGAATGWRGYLGGDLLEPIVGERELERISRRERRTCRILTPVDWDMIAMYEREVGGVFVTRVGSRL
jgi:hypothetical protein